MGQALYRKYRSKSLDEIVGQEPIVRTLKKAIQTGKISHAYLLTGPRGVGKTSVARILAHEFNKLSYTGEDFHIDIIEIDAASNRRIDEVRDIREKVHITPTSAKYKVYIIDEVHMLTKEAFNALLKTLEEPPEHVIFILATTEPHKLPATIISRTQHYSFKPIELDQIVDHLSQIAKREKIAVDKDALRILAEHGEGSLRDSISLFDQLSSSKNRLTVDRVSELLGRPPATEVMKLLQAVTLSDQQLVINLLTDLRNQGVSATQLAAGLSNLIRQSILSGTIDRHHTKLLKQLLEVSGALQPYDLLEIVLLEASFSGQPDSVPSQTKSADSVASHAQAEAESSVKPRPPNKKSGPSSFSLDIWPEVLTSVKSRAASIYTALRLAKPKVEGQRLILEFQFPLHKSKIAQASSSDLISNTIYELSGSKLTIETVITDRKRQQAAKTRPKSAGDVSNISNIFGSAEVLES